MSTDNSPHDAMIQSVLGTQDDLTTQLWRIIESQLDIIDYQGNSITSQRNIIQSQQTAIGVLKAANLKQEQQILRKEADVARAQEQTKFYMGILRESGTIRDAQEEKLDAMIEEIERLSIDFQVVNSQLRNATKQLATQKQPTFDWTDKKLYRRLIEIGKTDMAMGLLASARNVDRLAAVDRAWLYQNDEARDKPQFHNDLITDFEKRANAVGIRVTRDI